MPSIPTTGPDRVCMVRGCSNPSGQDGICDECRRCLSGDSRDRVCMVRGCRRKAQEDGVCRECHRRGHRAGDIRRAVLAGLEAAGDLAMAMTQNTKIARKADGQCAVNMCHEPAVQHPRCDLLCRWHLRRAIEARDRRLLHYLEDEH